jgi:hypothetical protein
LANREVAVAELSRLWTDLGSEDATQADRALWTLVAAAGQSVPLLKEQLPPAQRDPKLAEKVDKLITELDSIEFSVREKASAALAKFGGLAEPALKKALAADPDSLDLRVRIKVLLEQIEKSRWTGMSLQSWRALAVLERIGSDDARQVLEGLAEGDTESRVTQEAAAALERLHKVHSSPRKP